MEQPLISKQNLSVQFVRERLECFIVTENLNSALEAFEVSLSKLDAEDRNSFVLIAEESPDKFIGAFFASLLKGNPVFLANFDWKAREWEQFFSQVKPDIIFGNISIPENTRTICEHDLSHKIMIPSGGSGGKVKFAYHTYETLVASVGATLSFLSEKKLNSCCTLPLYHVSGLMQVMRSFISGGRIAFSNYKDFIEGKFPDVNPSEYYLSLVPTQLKHLLEEETARNWLKNFKAIFVGGAHTPISLLETARAYGFPLAPTYGSTETASMVTLLEPTQFLEGINSVGDALPHAQIMTDTDEAGQRGAITIKANSLFEGYYPEQPAKRSTFQAQDTGILSEEDQLIAVRRADSLIISGGEKIDPLEVQEALFKTGLIKDAIIVGESDEIWGERVVALINPLSIDLSVETLKENLQLYIQSHKIPKRWIITDQMPVNKQGKVDRSLIEQLL